MNNIARVTKLFFDQKAVTSAVDRGTRRALSKFGAIVRAIARASLRPSPGYQTRTLNVDGEKVVVVGQIPSRPGSPPFASADSPLRKFLWYSYDPARRSVVVGPVRLTRTRAQRMSVAPEALEYGGTSVHAGARVLRTGPRGGAYTSRLDFEVQVRPRPFMRPAMERARPKLPLCWANSVKS